MRLAIALHCQSVHERVKHSGTSLTPTIRYRPGERIGRPNLEVQGDCLSLSLKGSTFQISNIDKMKVGMGARKKGGCNRVRFLYISFNGECREASTEKGQEDDGDGEWALRSCKRYLHLNICV